LIEQISGNYHGPEIVRIMQAVPNIKRRDTVHTLDVSKSEAIPKLRA